MCKLKAWHTEPQIVRGASMKSSHRHIMRRSETELDNVVVCLNRGAFPQELLVNRHGLQEVRKNKIYFVKINIGIHGVVIQIYYRRKHLLR